MTGLYRRFVHSPSFAAWLAARATAMEAQVLLPPSLLPLYYFSPPSAVTASPCLQLTSIYVDALADADFGKETLAQKHHVEIVDLVLRIRYAPIYLTPW